MNRLSCNLVRRFGHDNSAVAAVEFVLVAPLLLLLYIGGVDTTRAIILHQRLQQTAAAITNLVSQATELKKQDAVEVFSVADVMLAGFGMNDFSSRVTVVNIDAAGNSTVQWSVGRNAAAEGKGSAYPLPDASKSMKNTTLIITEARNVYTPFMAYVFKKSIPIGAIAQGKFRGRKSVDCSDC